MTKQEKDATRMSSSTIIFLRVLSLLILALVIMIANMSIKTMQMAIATQNTAALLLPLPFLAIFMFMFLTLFLSQFPTMERGLTKTAAIASAGLVTIFLAVSFLILNSSVQRLPTFDENYWSAIQAACNGKGSNESAVYQPGAGTHKVVSSTRYLYFLPFEWLPTSLINTELVLCLDDQQSVTIDTCEYTGNQTFTRIQSTRKASLVALRTGAVLATTTFFGGLPADCPYQISGSRSDTGPDVEEGTIVDWMRPYIEK
jgi:hypothetical protein